MAIRTNRVAQNTAAFRLHYLQQTSYPKAGIKTQDMRAQNVLLDKDTQASSLTDTRTSSKLIPHYMTYDERVYLSKVLDIASQGVITVW